MEKLKICLCEDDPIWQQKVDDTLKKHNIEAELKCCDDETIDLEKEFDLYLLDIEFKNGPRLDIASKIKKRYPERAIVFLTAHDSYAIKGYEFSAKGFVYKPNFEQDFMPIVNQVMDDVKRKKLVINLCGDNISHEIKVDHISRVVTDGHYIRMKVSTRYERIRMSLKQFYKMFDLEDFVLISVGVYGNMNHISHISSNIVYFDDGYEAEIPVRRQKEVKEKYKNYILKKI